MSRDPIFDALNAQAAPTTAQRIVPEHNRYRWEQQWLKENREASGVIAHAARPVAAGTAAAATLAADAARSVDRAALSPGQSPDRATSSNVAPASAQPPSSPLFAMTIHATAPEARTAPPAAQREAPMPAPAVDMPPGGTAALAARRRTALKQFALWRADDEVKVAMRLDESAPDAEAAIGALRQWLKEMRLKLGTLIVNGDTRWQARPRNTDDHY